MKALGILFLFVLSFIVLTKDSSSWAQDNASFTFDFFEPAKTGEEQKHWALVVSGGKLMFQNFERRMTKSPPEIPVELPLQTWTAYFYFEPVDGGPPVRAGNPIMRLATLKGLTGPIYIRQKSTNSYITTDYSKTPPAVALVEKRGNNTTWEIRGNESGRFYFEQQGPDPMIKSWLAIAEKGDVKSHAMGNKVERFEYRLPVISQEKKFGFNLSIIERSK